MAKRLDGQSSDATRFDRAARVHHRYKRKSCRKTRSTLDRREMRKHPRYDDRLGNSKIARHRDRGNLHEFLTAILFVHGGERSRRSLAHEFSHVARALEDVSLGQTRVRLHDMVPRPGTERSHRDVHPSCGQLATGILEHVVRRERALDGVRGVQLKLAVSTGGLK